MRALARHVTSCALALCAAGFATACDPTAVDLLIDGPFIEPVEIDSLVVRVQNGEVQTTFERALSGGRRALVESVRLLPGEKIKRAFAVEVTGRRGADDIASAAGEGAFVDGQHVDLVLHLVAIDALARPSATQGVVEGDEACAPAGEGCALP